MPLLITEAYYGKQYYLNSFNRINSSFQKYNNSPKLH